jgi:pentatricopeptide repeat protein
VPQLHIHKSLSAVCLLAPCCRFTVPNEVTYNVLLSICAQAGRWASTASVLSDMESEGLTPTLYQYNCAFAACDKALRWREAVALYSRLRTVGIQPLALSYAHLVSHFSTAFVILVIVFAAVLISSCSICHSFAAGVSCCSSAGLLQLLLLLV